MSQSIKKFLRFNDKNVYFMSANGTWYIAIKPICEALGVDYSRQLRTLKEDSILGQLWSLQTIVAADGKQRQMVCLGEFFLYGWIFCIQSESPSLQEYKWKCYELLHNHFRGMLGARETFLKVKTQAELEMEKLEARLMENADYVKLQEMKGTVTKAKKELLKLDKSVVEGQLELWQSET